MRNIFFLLCGGGHITEFPLLLKRLAMVFKSVNDLLERTYCIIERIHFAGPSAARTGYTVAASLEKTRTYLLYRPFAEGTPRL